MTWLGNLIKLALAILSIMTDKDADKKEKKKECLDDMKKAIANDDTDEITAIFDRITRM